MSAFSAFELPDRLTVGGREWAIRADFRDVLTVLTAFEDEALADWEKAMICLNNLYADFEIMPRSLYQEAFEAALGFIDHGAAAHGGARRTMDWAQDAPLLFPAVNRAAGREVRDMEFLHWWTFLGYFMEIRDSAFATVLSLRQKKARGKRLEKHEREFWASNRELCELKRRQSGAEAAEKARLEALLNGK